MKRLEMLQGLAVSPLLVGAAVMTQPAPTPSPTPSPTMRPATKYDGPTRFVIVHPGEKGGAPWLTQGQHTIMPSWHEVGKECPRGICSGTGVPALAWYGP